MPLIITKIYRGECEICHCQVEVVEEELMFEDGTNDCYVHCPTKGCRNPHLKVGEHLIR